MTDDPVLAALERLQEGQKTILETLDRLSHDQAMLVDALGYLRKDVRARMEVGETAGPPTLHRVEEDHQVIREELSRVSAKLMVRVDEAMSLLHRRLIALEERVSGSSGRENARMPSLEREEGPMSDVQVPDPGPPRPVPPPPPQPDRPERDDPERDDPEEPEREKPPPWRNDASA